MFSTSVRKHFKDFQITHFSYSVLMYFFISCVTWKKNLECSTLENILLLFLVIFNIYVPRKCNCSLLWAVEDEVGYILRLICTGVSATSEWYSRCVQLKLGSAAALTGRGKSRKAVFQLHILLSTSAVKAHPFLTKDFSPKPSIRFLSLLHHVGSWLKPTCI